MFINQQAERMKYNAAMNDYDFNKYLFRKLHVYTADHIIYTGSIKLGAIMTDWFHKSKIIHVQRCYCAWMNMNIIVNSVK